MANGIILWEGASLLDGAPIVAIAIGTESASSNRKTGGMLQTYILRRDLSPVDAVHAGADVSICGTCPHRGAGDGTGRTCYVNIGQGPTGVWKAYKRGAYPRATTAELYEIGRQRLVRLGTYGDPAAVPSDVWSRLICFAVGHTGYTHAWRTHRDLRGIVMASADSLQDMRDATADGWRTFRVAMCNEPRQANERTCPASAEAGARVQCFECLACHGTGQGKASSIVINPHGGTAVMANVRKYQSAVTAAAVAA